MAFSEEQHRELARKLDAGAVKSRQQSGRSLSYLEGWHVIAEANRIFGFENWSRETVETRLVAEHQRKVGKPPNDRDGWGVSYVCRVRVIVFAGGANVTREGIGSGHGIDADLGLAHESAVKEAETDAMKRCLMTFGNPFGLALYDKAQEGVERAPAPKRTEAPAKASAPPAPPSGLAEQLMKTLSFAKDEPDLDEIKNDPDFKTQFQLLGLADRARVAEHGKTVRAGFLPVMAG
jgi:DNA recombination protein Rad52